MPAEHTFSLSSLFFYLVDSPRWQAQRVRLFTFILADRVCDIDRRPSLSTIDPSLTIVHIVCVWVSNRPITALPCTCVGDDPMMPLKGITSRLIVWTGQVCIVRISSSRSSLHLPWHSWCARHLPPWCMTELIDDCELTITGRGGGIGRVNLCPGCDGGITYYPIY